MFCPNCGNELKKGDKFCAKCGTQIGEDSLDQEKIQKKIPSEKKPGVKKKTVRLLIFIAALPMAIFALILLTRFFLPGIYPVRVTLGYKQFVLSIPGGDQGQEDQMALFESTMTAIQEENTGSSVESSGDDQDVVSTEEPEIERVLIFREDFNSDSSSVVPLLSEEYVKFRTSEGEGWIISDYGPGVLPILFGDFVASDFIAEFDFTAPEAYDDTNCGLIFRLDTAIDDGLNAYYALFLFPRENAIQLGLWIDDSWSKTEKIQLEKPFNSDYEPNHVRLKVVGEDMAVYVNGDFISGFREPTLNNPGLIGFFISPSASLPAGSIDYVVIDNLEIYQPENN
jgi:transcription initiation factor TFIIIB Brf1 subunit/transcription initiation factor TFIIB